MTVPLCSLILSDNRLDLSKSPAITNQIDIPQEWHYILLLIGNWLEAKRMKDMEEDLALKSQINQMINQMRTDEEEDFLRQKTGGIFVQTEAE